MSLWEMTAQKKKKKKKGKKEMTAQHSPMLK